MKDGVVPTVLITSLCLTKESHRKNTRDVNSGELMKTCQFGGNDVKRARVRGDLYNPAHARAGVKDHKIKDLQN